MVRRVLASAGFVLMAALFASAEDKLPSSDSDDSFDIEPPLLIPYREPGEKKIADLEPDATPAPDVEKLTRDVERAKRNAISAERLFRMGALAKIEAEQKALRVVRLEADLENARLSQLKEQTNQAEPTKSPEPATPQPQQMDSSKDAELAKAIEAAHAATKQREEAELAAAEADLERQRKLLSLGSGHKSSVAKAEQKLEKLKAARN